MFIFNKDLFHLLVDRSHLILPSLTEGVTAPDSLPPELQPPTQSYNPRGRLKLKDYRSYLLAACVKCVDPQYFRFVATVTRFTPPCLCEPRYCEPNVCGSNIWDRGQGSYRIHRKDNSAVPRLTQALPVQETWPPLHAAWGLAPLMTVPIAEGRKTEGEKVDGY